jgi:hypothetical protein
MEQVPCIGCNIFFTPRNQDQNFCSKPICQKIRKAIWQKMKIATDPEYKDGQRLAQKKWLQNNPDYWKKYRKKNREKTERNRQLQKVRNMRQRKIKVDSQAIKSIGIAKMDVRKGGIDRLSGQYWLVPEVAKMDPVKIFIAAIPDTYP